MTSKLQLISKAMQVFPSRLNSEKTYSVNDRQQENGLTQAKVLQKCIGCT